MMSWWLQFAGGGSLLFQKKLVGRHCKKMAIVKHISWITTKAATANKRFCHNSVGEVTRERKSSVENLIDPCDPWYKTWEAKDEGRIFSVTAAERFVTFPVVPPFVDAQHRSLCFRTFREIHRAGVVHRDIRCDNIAVGVDGLPVVIDFDHSRRDATEEQKREELIKLGMVLDGKGDNMLSAGSLNSAM